MPCRSLIHGEDPGKRDVRVLTSWVRAVFCRAAAGPCREPGSEGGSEAMMSGLLFVSQAVLESWTEQGKIDFQGDLMTLCAGEGQGYSYVLGPAVRFMKVLGTDVDPNALLGRVKTDSQLRALGAEQVGD